MSRGVCETCVVRALDALDAHRAVRSPPPRGRPHRTLVAVALGSALLGIVSATAASLASVHYIQNVQLRALAPGRAARRSSRPQLVGVAGNVASVVNASNPTPQPAAPYALPPTAALPPQAPEGPASILANAGPTTHDPAYLVARARRLADAGADVSVVSLRLPLAALDHAVQAMLTAPGSTRISPLYREGRAAGLRIQSPSDPLMGLAGIRDGDVLTAVNGYALPTLESAAGPFDRAIDERLFVAELIRDAHRVVLVISWPDESALWQRDRRDAAAAQARRTHEVRARGGASRRLAQGGGEGGR